MGSIKRKALGMVMICMLSYPLMSCGKSNSEYDSIINMLDNHDYEGAIKEINDLKQQYEGELQEEAMEPYDDNYVIVHPKDIENWIKTIPLTQENAMDYFELTEVTNNHEDAFGEPTGDVYTGVYLVPKDCKPYDVVIRVSYYAKNTNESYYLDTDSKYYNLPTEGNEVRDLTIWQPDCSQQNIVYTKYRKTINKYEEPYSYDIFATEISDFTIEKVTGEVEVLNIPNEYWNASDETGERYILVNYNPSSEPTNGLNFIKLYENGSYESNGELHTLDELTYSPEEVKKAGLLWLWPHLWEE